MYVQSIVVLVLLHAVGVSHATSPKATRLIESICDALDAKDGPRNGDDQKWESICQELFQSKRDGQNADELIQRILAGLRIFLPCEMTPLQSSESIFLCV